MKKVLLLFVLLLIIVGGIVLAQNYLREDKISLFKKSPTVTIGDHKFEVTIADSQKEREIGLSETRSLPENQGMIFTFEKPDYYSFWMKNMTIPIDIIYINKDVIATIHKNVQPPANQIGNSIIYTPEKPSDKVLEISAGLSKKYNFKKGDKVKYENLGN